MTQDPPPSLVMAGGGCCGGWRQIEREREKKTNPTHSASVMSAPAALAMSKILYPETETPVTQGTVKVTFADSHEVNGAPLSFFLHSTSSTSRWFLLPVA